MIISIGHKISLESSLRVVKQLTKFRVPQPIRMADKRSRELLAIVEQDKSKYTVNINCPSIKLSYEILLQTTNSKDDSDNSDN